MKSKNLNGQMLSEKEMREVKGGVTITLNADFSYCPLCGFRVEAKAVGKNYEAYCPLCKSHLVKMTKETNK